MFWAGLFIGLFIGAGITIFTFALCATADDGEDE